MHVSRWVGETGSSEDQVTEPSPPWLPGHNQGRSKSRNWLRARDNSHSRKRLEERRRKPGGRGGRGFLGKVGLKLSLKEQEQISSIGRASLAGTPSGAKAQRPHRRQSAERGDTL